jgi:hypothetical protein
MELAAPEDHVPRLQAFKEAHPDIEILPPTQFTPSWAARRGDELLVSCIRLKNFLDALDELASNQ